MPRVSLGRGYLAFQKGSGRGRDLVSDELLEVLPGLGEPRYPPIRAETFHTRITSKYYGDDYAAES